MNDFSSPRSSGSRRDTTRIIRAPHGNQLSAKSWLTEAPLRMLMNNLDPEVAEKPEELIVYGGIGRAARDWECFDKIVEVLKALNDDETLLVQSGKPVGVFKTHADAPRVLIANSNLVPHWATWEHFHDRCDQHTHFAQNRHRHQVDGEVFAAERTQLRKATTSAIRCRLQA